MEARTPPAAAILAGGRARRMAGADKSALLVGDRPILERQLAALRPLVSDIFIVGRPPGGLPPGMRVVPDRIPGAGALGGIYTAIVESPCDRTLVLACDMPFVSPRLLERLVAEEGDLVMPRTARGYEPLCAVYARVCAGPIRERIAHGDLQASIPPGGVRLVELGPDVLAALDPGGATFTNVNTPDDHLRARNMAKSIKRQAKG